MWRKPPCPVISRLSVLFAQMTERWMPEIVGQRDRLGQVLVHAQRAGERARDARDLDRVGHPRAIMIACAVEENLRLVLEPAEGAAVHDPVAVPLESSAETVLVLRVPTRPAMSALFWAKGARWRCLHFLPDQNGVAA